MNLRDTVKALEAKGVIVALDIGVHGACELDSNCPLAIQLRRLTAEAGITLEQLLEGYQAVTAPDPVDINESLPQFNSVVHLSIAGKVLDLDITDAIGEQLKVAIERKLRDADRLSDNIRAVGGSLYTSYLHEINAQRDNYTLPQVSFPVSELIETGCLVTCGSGEYNFFLPSKYNPQYLVRNSIRYKLSDTDIRRLKQKMYLSFAITQGGKFREAQVLDSSGDKLRHYHGDSTYDCWGSVTLPPRWDGRLGTLNTLARTLTMSLMTVNYDSLMSHEPVDMPSADSLLERSTKLGREGELEVQAVEPPTERTGWGGGARWRGRRQTGGATMTPPPGVVANNTVGVAAEMIRRFGRPTVDGDHETVCNLCGEPLGNHYGQRAEVCPRDHNHITGTPEEERMRRWGSPDIPADMTLICALCGETAGRHYERGLICPRDR